jgi:hypothetical protein
VTIVVRVIVVRVNEAQKVRKVREVRRVRRVQKVAPLDLRGSKECRESRAQQDPLVFKDPVVSKAFKGSKVF